MLRHPICPEVNLARCTALGSSWLATGAPDPDHGAPAGRWTGTRSPDQRVAAQPPRGGCRAGPTAGRTAPRWRQRPQRLVVGRRHHEEVDAEAEEVAEEEAVGLEPGVDGRIDLWRTSRPALLELAVQGDKVGADCWAREVFGQKMSGLGSPTDLEEREVASTQPLLDPQLSHS